MAFPRLLLRLTRADLFRSHLIGPGMQVLLLFCFNVNYSYAVDVAIFPRQESEGDRRGTYSAALLKEVLRRTEQEFGPYQLKFSGAPMLRDRKLVELKSGKLINVAAMPTSPQWEHDLIPTLIPIDMGLQSWRISLIDEKNQERLRAVRSLEELKRLKAGVGIQWVSYSEMQEAGFNVVAGSSYDGLFGMLMAGRFDYFPRALKDVFVEFDARKAENRSLAVEDHFALFFPFPLLFFTSPTEPRLAKRISAGMEMMLKDGSLQRFVLDFHKDLLQRANICSRTVFVVPNPHVNPALLKRREIWFDPLAPKNGICPENIERKAG
jgi:hypothetical protein